MKALPDKAFLHFLAYGNSDQASFRDREVRETFDVMTVPGTIAAYYDQATPAFVLSSRLDYLIDPRTPLFQETLDAPRASHYSLAEWHGPDVLAALPPLKSGDPALYPAAFYDDAVVAGMVRELVGRQRGYAAQGAVAQTKVDRYQALLALALGEIAQEQVTEPGSPAAVLAPYFAVRGPLDPWWTVMGRVWEACANLAEPETISPVVCVGPRDETEADGRTVHVDGVDVLRELLLSTPDALARTVYFWVTGLDERTADERVLRSLWRTIASGPPGRLVNLYGGFFSICLRYAGLLGFGNGLTYSESRSWPALSSTGAAPARFYIRDAHMFLPVGTAALLLEADPSFECPCPACATNRAAGVSVASMQYHDLKRHFALARSWEMALVAGSRPADVADHLAAVAVRLRAARDALPVATRIGGGHLDRWSAVLRNP